MLWSYKTITLPVLLAFLAGSSTSASLAAAVLNLAAAEELALRADPGVQAVEANQAALNEMAVAARQMPDPMIKMGLMSLPVNTFDLDREPMTQAQLGVMQTFPRGRSRELRAEQINLQSRGLDDIIRDQKLQILLAVREQYLEVVKQQHLAKINADAQAVFSDLVEITQDYYATGRVQQQDVLQAAVELARVQDRATRIKQEEEQARARLATWTGGAAFDDIPADWPELRKPEPVAAMKDKLRQHPKIRAMQKKVSAADTGVELARQNYRPEFSLDLTYGFRTGSDADGSSWPDMLSVMLVMDLPLFRDKRQDRVLAAQIQQSSNASFDLDDVLRRMVSDIDLQSATYRRQKERVELFETSLLPKAAFNAEATYEAYQSAVGDMTTLLRAHLTEFDLQLEHVSLQAEVLESRARLLYLEGEQK